jgi:hypothetical protein
MKIVGSVLIFFSILVSAPASRAKGVSKKQFETLSKQWKKECHTNDLVNALICKWKTAEKQIKQIHKEQASVRQTEKMELERLRRLYAIEGRAADVFWVKVDRTKTINLKGEPPGQNRLVLGSISVNGKVIGNTYENADLMIPLGDFGGIIRYTSKKGFAQNPLGEFTHEGDFLLEVSNVPGKTGILFHGGNKPKYSTGCILLGPVRKNALTGKGVVGPNHPLRILRREFYGLDDPYACPNKSILIRITNQTMLSREKEQAVRAEMNTISMIGSIVGAAYSKHQSEIAQGFEDMRDAEARHQQLGREISEGLRSNWPQMDDTPSRIQTGPTTRPQTVYPGQRVGGEPQQSYEQSKPQQSNQAQAKPQQSHRDVRFGPAKKNNQAQDPPAPPIP